MKKFKKGKYMDFNELLEGPYGPEETKRTDSSDGKGRRSYHNSLASTGLDELKASSRLLLDSALESSSRMVPLSRKIFCLCLLPWLCPIPPELLLWLFSHGYFPKWAFLPPVFSALSYSHKIGRSGGFHKNRSSCINFLRR